MPPGVFFCLNTKGNSNMSDETGRVALITGAGRGIGAELAKIQAARGNAVALCARSLDQVAAVADEISSGGGRAIAVACDVSDEGQVARYVEAAQSAFGRIDILVNNAGALEPEAMIADAEPGLWRDNLQINLLGPFLLAQAVLPQLTASDDGVLINISTGAAHHPLTGWSAYCAAKAGLAMFTQCLHAEHGPQDQGGGATNANRSVRIYGFAPGTVWTAMQEAIREKKINPVADLPEDALHSPRRPAHIIDWLTTPDAADLAGQELAVGDNNLRARAGVPAELEIGGR
jgi:NAD(P)-dependent dehydrogenase (short-subunit alcohol dehydrogenase family)